MGIVYPSEQRLFCHPALPDRGPVPVIRKTQEGISHSFCYGAYRRGMHGRPVCGHMACDRFQSAFQNAGQRLLRRGACLHYSERARESA